MQAMADDLTEPMVFKIYPDPSPSYWSCMTLPRQPPVTSSRASALAPAGDHVRELSPRATRSYLLTISYPSSMASRAARPHFGFTNNQSLLRKIARSNGL